MTLSDLLALLRARRGGVFYSDVAEATKIPALHLVRAERTFSVASLTPDELARLAEYFEVPVDELHEAQRQTRASLTSYLAEQEKARSPAKLRLFGGVSVAGPLLWRDRHAIALLQPDSSTIVVYRSNIEGWGA